MTAVYEMNDEERRIAMLALAGFELDRDERVAIRPLYLRLFVDAGGTVKPGVEVRPAVRNPPELYNSAPRSCNHEELFAKYGGTYAPVSCPYCKPPLSPQEVVLQQIAAERKSQDRQWGGATHDDDHEQREWLNFIKEHTERARKLVGKPDDYRHRIIVIAALAVAAVEAFDRGGRPA